ncbi:4a-hydroxytetrahydrobiopterin dehydratase [Rhodomicrobium lacus]|uniref:4a-hydroxytetrahydrobiopterin dehydratase n=1 Tax=Rhodomicrobium lacus TaxID=2498452 RepID=UPI0026E33C04|nr:4a-hydroxytetrahydrobiopterin dehydratase [Rhodomicrobium lacus]WKW49869.1 4a-hydroxytetrahydrobiopterin dehydratase [Rhodomicrobium lacus]
MSYDEKTIAARLEAELPCWTYAQDYIRRVYVTKKWGSTLALANAIGWLAEAAQHHPDLLLTYGSLELRLQTHDAGGVTEKDFALAKKIEEIASWRGREQ